MLVHDTQPLKKHRKNAHKVGPTEYPFPEPLDRDRPSDYLCAQCPLCFGGKMAAPNIEPHSLVSVDACFQQKHNKQICDPPHEHPHSIFLDKKLVDQMEAYINSICPPKETKASHSNEDDAYEHESLKVPRSVLDACNESFIAADESCEKVSVKFFDITGLMSLICCHDCVLWVVNMMSAGEKQRPSRDTFSTFASMVDYWLSL